MNSVDASGRKPPFSQGMLLWLLFFCFATSAALLFQKFLLPMMPHLHAGQGLLDGDSLYFHSVAVELAEKIKHEGWHSWTLVPGLAATGNVALLGALYAVFGVDPTLIIPINAALHALGGLMIFRIAGLLAPGRVGHMAGLCGALLFIAFPSALNWYGQVHKDGFSIAAFLILIYSWLRTAACVAGERKFMIAATGTLTAVSLMAFVRPYNLIPLFAVMLAVFTVTVTASTVFRRTGIRNLGALALSMIIMLSGAIWAKQSGSTESYTYDGTVWAEALGDWKWKPSPWMPNLVEGYAETTARTRARSMHFGRRDNAGSMIDTEIKPDHVEAVIGYAPRALQIALFAPFPSTWLDKLSAARLVSIAENSIWYLLAPGVVIAVYLLRSGPLLTALGFATLFLYIYGFVIPNVGTLYRIRYPFLFIFILAGLIGWFELMQRRQWWLFKRQLAPPPRPERTAAPAAAVAAASRRKMFDAGAAVALLTGVGYFGLFFRDVLLARWFGTGSALDSFFLATALPMFLVATMSIPIGTMLVPQFLAARDQQSPAAAQQLVSKISFVYLCVVLAVAAAMWLGAVPLLASIAPDFTPEKLDTSATILRWMLPILALSGLVIMNNAMLNILGRYTVPSASQIAVPVASILALFAFGADFGIRAVVAGMLAGQVINLILVNHSLRQCGFSVRPRWVSDKQATRVALEQYLPLVAAALFVNIATPVNMSMAASLVEGSVGALGLGNKIVTLSSGLVAAAITAVVLPYFSSLLARNRLLDARNELSFFVLAATVVTIPLTLVMFEAAEPIIRLAFKGGAFDDNAVSTVARVMSYGILQLPFYTVNLLILKFAIASHRAGRVMLASLLGLAVNIILNLLLMKTLGAAGIALATTLATATSTVFMLLLFNRLGHISWIDLTMIALSWMLFTTLVICLHYQSYPGVIVSLIALSVFLYSEWNILARWRAEA